MRDVLAMSGIFFLITAMCYIIFVECKQSAPTTHQCTQNKELDHIRNRFEYWHNSQLNERQKRDSIYTDLSKTLILGI